MTTTKRPRLPPRPVPTSFSRVVEGEVTTLTLTLPIKIVSEANQREHWGKKAERVKKQRRVVGLALKAYAGKPPEPPFAVHLVRIDPRRLDAHDNLRSAFKACADSIAEFCGFNDKDERVTWTYGQESAPTPRTYGTRIEIRKGKP